LSEQFYRKKQLLKLRDQLLEDIGRAVYKSGSLPEAFKDLPKAIRMKDKFLDHVRDRKKVLRHARTDVMLALEGLDRESGKLESEIDEKLSPFFKERDQLYLRLDHAKDRFGSSGRRNQNYAQEIEDLSCRIGALDLRIEAGEKHRRTMATDIENRARPLRERLKKLNQNLGQALREEEQLKSHLHKRLRDLGFHYLDTNREPEKFAPNYEELSRVISELADYRKSVPNRIPERVTRREGAFWKWMLLAFGLALMVMILFRTQYQQGEISFGDAAANFLQRNDDYRFFVDLNRPGLQSWRAAVPELESLPGGTVFSGIARQDILAFVEVREQFGEGEFALCGIKLRKTPARFAYRLAQQGWRREATKLGYEALGRGNLIWLVLTDREFLLLPRAALASFNVRPESADGPIFRIEKKITPFEKHLTLLQGFDLMMLEVDRSKYRLTLSATQSLHDVAMRRDWLKNQVKKGVTESDIAILEDSLVMKGTYDPLEKPFVKDELKAFVENKITGYLGQPKVGNAPAGRPAEVEASFTELASFLQPQRQGIAVYRHDQGSLDLTQTLPLGLSLSDLVWLNNSNAVLAVDMGSRSLFKLRLSQSRLQVESQLWLNSPEVTALLGERRPPFVPGRLFKTPDEDVGVLLEGILPKDRRPRMLLLDLRTLHPVAVEDLPSHVKRPLVAQWDESGHDLYIGVEPYSRSRVGVTRVLGFRREGHVLALSRVIRSKPDPVNGGVVGLLNRNMTQDLILHQMPGQLVTRYQFERGMWVEQETIELEPEPGHFDEHELKGPSMVMSRTGNWALVLSGNTVEGDAAQQGIHLLDLTTSPLSSVMKLPLDGAPSSILRMPLSDRYWVCMPNEKVLAPVVLKDRQLAVETDKVLNMQTLHPTIMVSDQWGEFLLVAGIFDSGFPMP